MLESWKLFSGATGTELMRKCSGWVIREGACEQTSASDGCQDTETSSANQRTGLGHKWPIRSRDADGGCSYRMRVTGTLIEIKNQQRMQTIDVEGGNSILAWIRLISKPGDMGCGGITITFNFVFSPFLLSPGVDGPANFMCCNDIICDDICPRYRDIATLSDDGDICPLTRYRPGSCPPMSQCSHWSPLLSAPLLASHPPSRVTHLWRKSGHSTSTLYAPFSVSKAPSIILQIFGKLIYWTIRTAAAGIW